MLLWKAEKLSITAFEWKKKIEICAIILRFLSMAKFIPCVYIYIYIYIYI